MLFYNLYHVNVCTFYLVLEAIAIVDSSLVFYKNLQGVWRISLKFTEGETFMLIASDMESFCMNTKMRIR